MVVLVRSYGNHSNRLFQNLHFEAFCREHRIPFLNATFMGMAPIYALPPKYCLSFFYLILFRITKRFNLIPYVPCNRKEDIEESKKKIMQGANMLMFVGGWEFRDFESVSRQQEFFRQKYSVVRSNKHERSMTAAMKQYDVLVGVHVRRGDYQQWMDGKYCFDNAVYRRIVQDFVNLHGSKKILVLYFSKEYLDPDELSCTADVRFSRNPYFIDYRLMGHCHYLIGPVSTFTMWASFLYRVPYVHIEHAQQKIRLSDFTLCQG
jgi:hypothetical protein